MVIHLQRFFFNKLKKHNVYDFPQNETKSK